MNKEIKKIYGRRSENSHKYDFGRLLIYAGSPGMHGAAVLCARAALRAGCGLVYITSDREMAGYFNMTVPEAVFVADKDIKHIINKIDAVVVGPGIGVSDDAKDKVINLINSVSRVVLDADGLNNLSLNDIAECTSEMVLTPHNGELARLINEEVCYITRNEKARRLFNNVSKVVVAKGHKTLVVGQDGEFECQYGGPELATAGSGDVLSGIIGACMAMGNDAFASAAAGVTLHALSGVKAKQKSGEYGCIASDLIDNLAEVVLENA